MSLKKKVAVLFGGRSPEHDVSIVTGLQVLNALDPALYDAFPVYLSITGEWLVGDKLRDRAAYIPESNSKDFEKVELRFRTKTNPPAFISKSKSFFKKPKIIEVDFAIPAFHGVVGEDGAIQGLLEVAGIPYGGMRVLASAIFMNKVSTKHMLAATGVPLLPFVVINRPSKGRLILPKDLAAQYPDTKFPCCIKPVNLGSSIGVAKVNDWEELSATLPQIFKFDDAAILEPFVQNLVEYNVAVSRLGGVVRTSAIERPKHSSELLDFKTKYLSGENNKSGGIKTPQQSSEGMLSLTRDINPVLPKEMEENIRKWAMDAFLCVGGTGAPRIDFLCDSATGQVWLNEVNSYPGSFGYFLWEAAIDPINFSSLLDMLIEEGESCYSASELPPDPIPEQARLFTRR